MSELGNFFLFLAWLFSVYGLGVGFIAGKRTNDALALTTARATLLVFLFTTLSIASLSLLFFQSDFTNQYVWQYSNRDMEWYYRISAIWGGMDGSMLLWCFFLSISGAVVANHFFDYPRPIRQWLYAIVNSSSVFFLTIVLFFTNPFRFIKSSFVPPDGNGLNPLLQNPYMAIHPPTLYAGFTTLAIPFAFCLAALLAGERTSRWIQLSRRWTLIAWGFLTAGICLGGYWAYIELGWGGFWAWDPVENASFMPWLTATAFLHSVMVQERKDMLKIWNVCLIVLTYGLTVFGTFLTRSGIVQSVHAFASTDIGWVFLLYLGILFVGSAALIFYRRDLLRATRPLESLLSREAAFLVNNLLFLCVMFSTLWGVMFPIISEAVTGEKQAVSAPFFNAVNVPVFLALVFLMGVGPLVAWKKAQWSQLRKSFAFPLFAGFVASLLLLWAGISSYYAVVSYGLCFFVTLTIIGEFHKGTKTRGGAVEGGNLATNFMSLFRRQRKRYGAFIIHLGVVFATIGITASMAHKLEREFVLGTGESYTLGRYEITLKQVASRETKNHESLYAVLEAKDVGSDSLTVLHPELRFYKRNSETTTEVALKRGLREDLYLVLAGLDDTGAQATFKGYINPLQMWLWIGVMIMLAGTGIVIGPRTSTASEQVIEPETGVVES